MSIGSWDPAADAAAHSVHIEAESLLRFIKISKEGQLEQLEQLIVGDEAQVLSGLMTLDSAHWLAAANPFTDEDLLHLVRFFTVAENLPGWEAGEKSPAIPLAKTLRKRGTRLDKDLLQWIRSVSNNRYLPYGPL
jgi:hypothetical protein